jgi:hypothetical protein
MTRSAEEKGRAAARRRSAFDSDGSMLGEIYGIRRYSIVEGGRASASSDGVRTLREYRERD